MPTTMWNWLSNLIYEFAKFGSWLTQPLPYINISPLAVFSFTGITAIIVFLLVRLVVGGQSMFEFLTNPIIAWLGLPSATALLLLIIIIILIIKD